MVHRTTTVVGGSLVGHAPASSPNAEVSDDVFYILVHTKFTYKQFLYASHGPKPRTNCTVYICPGATRAVATTQAIPLVSDVRVPSVTVTLSGGQKSLYMRLKRS